MKVAVLRLGHRFMRDRRTSTHVALVSRAFGAQELILDSKDEVIKKSVEGVVKEWGGEFKIKFSKNWKELIQNFPGDKIHLTMYGINIDKKMGKIKKSVKDKLIVVGGKKVPADVYHLVDYNIAIGNQPHSEIAALALFLDRLFEGKEINKNFQGRRKEIIPRERGKKVLEKDK